MQVCEVVIALRCRQASVPTSLFQVVADSIDSVRLSTLLPTALCTLPWLGFLDATVTYYITLHYNTLHYVTLQYITLHYITLHYITLHYITRNALQHKRVEPIAHR